MKEKIANPEPVRVRRPFSLKPVEVALVSGATSVTLSLIVAYGNGIDRNSQHGIFLFSLVLIYSLTAATLSVFSARHEMHHSLVILSEKSIQVSSVYLRGDGVIKSLEIAEEHYQKAVAGFTKVAKESTFPDTCFCCAQALEGLTKDDGFTVYPATKFADLRVVAMAYLRAALLGSPAAQFKVALHYQDGIGFSTDFCEAYAWFNICAASKYFGGERARESLACRMNPDEISLAQKRSLELLAMVNGKA